MVNWKTVNSDGIKIPATVWQGFFCGVLRYIAKSEDLTLKLGE
jgi:hypothetical protein